MRELDTFPVVACDEERDVGKPGCACRRESFGENGTCDDDVECDQESNRCAGRRASSEAPSDAIGARSPLAEPSADGGSALVIVGAVIGSLCFVFLILLVVFFGLRYKNQRQARREEVLRQMAMRNDAMMANQSERYRSELLGAGNTIDSVPVSTTPLTTKALPPAPSRPLPGSDASPGTSEAFDSAPIGGTPIKTYGNLNAVIKPERGDVDIKPMANPARPMPAIREQYSTLADVKDPNAVKTYAQLPTNPNNE